MPESGAAVDAAVWAIADCLQWGMFRINQEGYIVQYNNVAGDIMAFDAGVPWEDRHVSSVDRILDIGLAEQCPAILQGDSPFLRQNLNCTNSHGRFMVLDLAAVPVNGSSAGNREIMGFVRDRSVHSEHPDHSQGERLQLGIISEVAAALSSSIELSQVLKIILTGATASQGLGFNRAFLFLYDVAGNKLRGHLAVGPRSAEEAGHIWNRLDSMRLSLSELLDTDQEETGTRMDSLTDLITNLEIDLEADSLISRACRDGVWINLEKAGSLDAVTTTVAQCLETRCLALVPMISKGHLRGLLAADNSITRQQISDDAVHLLQVLANQAAVAMERARLYDAEKERAEQLELMNAQLAASQDQIIKIEKISVIGELTSAVAHELRNPLTIIGGFTNLLLKSELNDEQREYLGIIAGEVKRTEAVVDHVLDFSRASREESRPLELSALVQHCLDLLAGRLRQRQVEISLSQARDKLMIYGNHDQLVHAIYHLLKLIGDDVIPPGIAEVRTELRDGRASVSIKIVCPDNGREKAIKALKQLFTGKRSSQHLTILVALETIKYHGGDYDLAIGSDGLPLLSIELPLTVEGQDDATPAGG
ncbi:MAG: histidine kinase dimerization/phospho-acceptor domain-containing protein [bacterium]